LKAVVVLAQPPVQEGGAPGRCAIALIRGLMQHGIEVEVHAAHLPYAVIGDPPADLDVHMHDVRPPSEGWAGLARRLRRPTSDLLQPAFVEPIARAAAAADVVHLQGIETAWAALGLTTPASLDVQYRALRDRSLGMPWQGDFRRVGEFAIAERHAIKRFLFMTANSPSVAESLRRGNPSADVVFAPLSLEPDDYPAAAPPPAPLVGVIGTAGWLTTRRAMERLAYDVWPLIHAAVPDARAAIAGRGTDRIPGLSAMRGVETLGEVESAGAFVRTLSVLVFPLPRGSGMKVKVVEALASGVPIVTTACGAEGIIDNDGVIVAESDAELAAATVRLLSDEGERRERAAAARDAFLRHYNPKSAAEPVAALLERMAASR
jgi:glycosyltransferase involved in cell wall biosynthesis